MKSCSNRRLFSAATLITVFVTLTCCTKVDDKLGFNFIPDDQKTTLGIATLGLGSSDRIKAYITLTDTVYTQNQTVALFGKATDDFYGKSATATVLEFQPTGDRVDTTGHGFGYGATVDSVKFTGSFVKMSGNTDIEQKFNIYMMKDTLNTDTLLFKYYDWRAMVDQSDPLFTFSYSGESPSGQVELLKTDITPSGRLFVQKVLTDTTWYWNNDNTPKADSLMSSRKRFKKEFPGLVIAPAPGSPDNAAVYYMSLPYNYLVLYLHNYEDEGLNTIKDEHVELAFYTDDSGTSYTAVPRNNSVVCVENDYTGTAFDGIEPDKDPLPPLAGRTFVQGLCGVTTELELPDGFFEGLEALKYDENGVKLADNIFFSQARLCVWLDNPAEDLQVIKDAHQKLGSYMNYSSKTPIPDYSYYDESNSSNNVIAYGGQLNRTHGYYELNITSYLYYAYKDYRRYKNGEMNEGTLRQNKFTLAPVAYPSNPNEALNWRETALIVEDPDTDPATTKQPYIKLTYILVK